MNHRYRSPAKASACLGMQNSRTLFLGAGGGMEYFFPTNPVEGLILKPEYLPGYPFRPSMPLTAWASSATLATSFVLPFCIGQHIEYRANPVSCRSDKRTHHRIVGMTNSAPSLVPEGQRDVTVLVLV